MWKACIFRERPGKALLSGCRRSQDLQETREGARAFLGEEQQGGQGPGGTRMGRAGHAARPSPQAILPLMKFLEVELCYMNTNLVQENFSRSAAALPAAPTLTPAPPAPLSCLRIVPRGGGRQPLL